MALSQNGRSSRRRTNDAGQPQPTRQARDGGGHLPSAPRERRPLLAALAVLLIVGGALLAGLLAMRLDQRAQMLAAKDTIKAGQVIDKEDLVSASVSSDLTTLVRADQVDQVVGRTARVEISKGQLLDTSQLATDPVPGGDRGPRLGRGGATNALISSFTIFKGALHSTSYLFPCSRYMHEARIALRD